MDGELAAADRDLDRYATAPIILNVDLLEPGALTEREREPVIAARRPAAAACGDAFRTDFVAMLDRAPHQGDELLYAVLQSRLLDRAFDDCLRPAGLTGHPEFQVGGQYLRTQEFVRGYHAAGMRVGAARQQQAGMMGFAAVIGAMGRAAASPAMNPPPPRPTFSRPTRCTSYAYGGQLHTTCQ